MFLLLLACSDPATTPDDSATWEPLPAPLSAEQLEGFDVLRVKSLIDELGDDRYAGRTPGSPGHADARAWLEQELQEVGLDPVGSEGGYARDFALELPRTRYAPDESGQVVEVEADTGTNLLGLLPGDDLSHELIVVMAHYDHLGTTPEGEVYNGAYDDLGGVGTMLEIARLYKEEGIHPRRSILFLVTDGEEGGLQGARAWVEEQPWSMDEVVAAFSVDPVGRATLPDTWPLVMLGLERSPELKALWQEMGRSWSGVPVHTVNRAPIPLFASDQDAFYDSEHAIPAAWVTSPGFTWYHTTGDTPETIDYRTIQDHGRFLAQAFLHLASVDTRWEDLGEQEASAEDCEDSIALLETMLTSEELSDVEQATLKALISDFEELAAQGDALDPDDAAPVVVEALLVIMDELAQAHPGEVPPPMP